MGNCFNKVKTYFNYDKITEETKEEINRKILSEKDISKTYNNNYLYVIDHTIR